MKMYISGKYFWGTNTLAYFSQDISEEEIGLQQNCQGVFIFRTDGGAK
jgi:hypothetical protein